MKNIVKTRFSKQEVRKFLKGRLSILKISIFLGKTPHWSYHLKNILSSKQVKI